MGPLYSTHRMLSRPMDVHWAGWRSTTLQLQQAGWELSAEQDFSRCSMRVALHHRQLQCYAISAPIDDFQFEKHARGYGIGVNPELHIQCFGTRITIQFAALGPLAFKPIDAAPMFVNHEIRSVEDLNWFASPLVRTEEIIVEPETVQAMLDRIREMQAPEQAQIRARQRMAASRDGMTLEGRPQQKFHAQILSIAA